MIGDARDIWRMVCFVCLYINIFPTVLTMLHLAPWLSLLFLCSWLGFWIIKNVLCVLRVLRAMLRCYVSFQMSTAGNGRPEEVSGWATEFDDKLHRVHRWRLKAVLQARVPDKLRHRHGPETRWGGGPNSPSALLLARADSDILPDCYVQSSAPHSFLRRWVLYHTCWGSFFWHWPMELPGWISQMSKHRHIIIMA